MAQLFIDRVVGGRGRDWSVLPLEADLYRLSCPAGRAVDAAPSRGRLADEAPAVTVEAASLEAITSSGAFLVREGELGDGSGSEALSGTTARWAILWNPGTRVRINGIAVPTGMAMLRDRDEIGLEGSAPFYFSNEHLAEVEIYAGSDEPRCPRCTLPIERGEPFVRCPGCHVLHHQKVDRECFTYASTCALCDQPTSLDAGFRWSPEGL